MQARKRVQPDGKKSLRTVFLFCTVVAILILGSLVFKSVVIWQQNTFHGGYAYILQMTGKKDVVFVGFDTRGKKAAIFTVSGANNRAVSRDVGLPVDGTVEVDPLPTTHNSVSSSLLKSAFQMRSLKTTLTSFDFIRLAVILRGIPNGNVQTEDISYDQAAKGIDEIIGNAFQDSELVAEEKGIEIVNASETPGVATQLEQALNHLGANILAVKTSPSPEEESFIETIDEKSYTAKRLAMLLGYPVRLADNSELSDIRIVLGRDVSSTKRW